MTLLTIFSHRRRSVFTAGTDSVRADTWRPATEFKPALAWSVTASVAGIFAAAGLAPTLAATLVGLVSAFMAGIRLKSGMAVLKDRAALAGSALELVSCRIFARRLLRARRDMARKGDTETFAPVWFGRGFDWGPEHAQKLYELSKIDVERLIPHRNICRRLTGTAPKDPRTVGLAAIDGLESRKKDIWVSEKTLEGGTLIVGTTQAGKGVLLTSLVTQAILRGEAVIVIDPKMSSRLKNAVTAAAKLANRSDPLFFHPNDREGIRINPLTHFERPSEIASRLTAVMADSGPFTSFAWSAVNVVVNLLVHVGRTPSIAGIESVLTGDFEDLLLEAVELDCGPDLFDTLVSEVKLKGKKGREGVLVLLDKARDREALSEVTLKGAATYAHDPVHFSKITASLMPVLAMLTSGALRQTLSPADDDAEAMSLSEIIAQRKILYVCLNSLPDPTVAGAIGSLLLADLASCAGERYNDTSIARTTVSLFVDECSNVINRSLIEILNKGAESGLRTTCAMQTVADLAARLGSTDEARMALGNFNSLVSLRTKDRLTQEFVAETFGRTYIANTAATLTSASDTAHPGHFTAGASRQITASREEIIPCDVLGKLPNCEFFASLAGGRLVKGRTPILIADEDLVSGSNLSSFERNFHDHKAFEIPRLRWPVSDHSPVACRLLLCLGLNRSSRF